MGLLNLIRPARPNGPDPRRALLEAIAPRHTEWLTGHANIAGLHLDHLAVGRILDGWARLLMLGVTPDQILDTTADAWARFYRLDPDAFADRAQTLGEAQAHNVLPTDTERPR